MDLARLLKTCANLYVFARIAKLVARDLATRSPYGVAGAATAMGLVAGLLVGKRRASTL
jgi:ElaB/YqjD/DUF883 family membrane-anchored ribosome-binding protein